MTTAQFIPTIYFPRRAGDPAPEPVPFVCTAADTIRFLRLDETGVNDPTGTLEYYRAKGLLKGTQVGKCVRFLLPDLIRFLESAQELNPR